MCLFVCTHTYTLCVCVCRWVIPHLVHVSVPVRRHVIRTRVPTDSIRPGGVIHRRESVGEVYPDVSPPTLVKTHYLPPSLWTKIRTRSTGCGVTPSKDQDNHLQTTPPRASSPPTPRPSRTRIGTDGLRRGCQDDEDTGYVPGLYLQP